MIPRLSHRFLLPCCLGYCLVALALGLGAAGPVEAAAPASSAAPLIARLGFAKGEVGFILADVQSGKILESQSADQLFMPASVAKLANAAGSAGQGWPLTGSVA